MRLRLAIIAASVFSLCVLPLQAATCMTASYKPGPEEMPVTINAYLDTNCVRVMYPTAYGIETLIFRADQRKFAILSPNGKNIQIANEPDGKLEEAGATVPLRYVKRSAGINVNGHRCNFYWAMANAVKRQDLWTTDRRQVELSSEYLLILQRLRRVMIEIGHERDNFFQAGSREFEEAQGFSGIPVRQLNYDSKGQARDSFDLLTVEPIDLPADFFDLPAATPVDA